MYIEIDIVFDLYLYLTLILYLVPSFVHSLSAHAEGPATVATRANPLCSKSPKSNFAL